MKQSTPPLYCRAPCRPTRVPDLLQMHEACAGIVAAAGARQIELAAKRELWPEPPNDTTAGNYYP